MRKILAALLILLPGSLTGIQAQGITNDYSEVCDSISVLLKEKTAVDTKLVLKSVLKRGTALDFYFTESLGERPWRESDIKWFRTKLKELSPEKYKNMGIGEIYSKKIKLSELAVPALPHKGIPAENRFRIGDPRQSRTPIVREEGADFYQKGLSNRTIALWQSHGRYYEQKLERWEWQRPPLFETVEDVFTQTYVIPFLVPMLENAGAYVILPRERDYGTEEIILDNDSPTGYGESGKWESAGDGFANPKAVYEGLDNPFTMGTARMAKCSDKRPSEASWSADIPSRGDYAVYVSYKTLEGSSKTAKYSIEHLGGTSTFSVNQSMGGGTWVYLGTFPLGPEKKFRISLKARGAKNSVVCADAVKIGGGMGNIARKSENAECEACTSGFPRYAEGARYWMQWSGVPSGVWSQNEQKDDYRDDFMSRGAWVRWLCGGSSVNPDEDGIGIPCDLALALHSDAGVTPNDSIVGTLSIYTLLCENSRKMASGEDRMTQREYADFVQTQVTEDITALFNPIWARRGLWDRSYSESRTTGIPTILLEFLSHQNFADMRLGHDPAFKFAVSRAIYKGMLKYLADRYGCQYAVQPLPIHSFKAGFADSKTVELSWKETTDSLEPTANAEKYILYTRLDDGAFDGGRILEKTETVNGRIVARVPASSGHIVSYRIEAVNKGGRSFPSETLAVGIPEGKSPMDSCVLIVNNFTRVSAPVWYCDSLRAGFDRSNDSGVPYIKDAGYIGQMYEFRRDREWEDDDRPGFGASYNDEAGTVGAGNTFDYTAIHGKYFMKEGYPFISSSVDAFTEDESLPGDCWIADIICGKQLTVKATPQSQERYTVFPVKVQNAIRRFSGFGGNLLVSGAYIGTDICDCVYEYRKDSAATAWGKVFLDEILGFNWMTNHASKSGMIKGGANVTFQISNSRNSRKYSVESPDGIVPTAKNGKTIYRYCDSNVSAGVQYQGNGYRSVCLGFPIESVLQEDKAQEIVSSSIRFFRNGKK